MFVVLVKPTNHRLRVSSILPYEEAIQAVSHADQLLKTYDTYPTLEPYEAVYIAELTIIKQVIPKPS